MQSRQPFFIIVTFLFIAGILLCLNRGIRNNIPFFPGEQVTAWTIDAKITFRASGLPVEVSFALPSDSNFKILSENTTSPGYGLTLTGDIEKNNRRSIWSVRKAQGVQELYYKSVIISESKIDKDMVPAPTAPEPAIWLKEESAAAEQVMSEVWAKSASDWTFAVQLIGLLSEKNKDQNISLLLTTNTPQELFVKLLNSKNIPARSVRGLYLEDQRVNQKLVPLVEVYYENGWYLFDPEKGSFGRDENLLLWEHDQKSVLDVKGGKESNVSFSILKSSRPALQTAISILEENKATDFSLYQLPIEEQSMFKGILLIPIGVLVVVFLRIIVGVKTSGTFMPVLIAVAFIQTTLLTGVIGFLLIVSTGLIIRSYLSYLNLLLISRISSVIIVVIGIIGVFTILSYNLGLTKGLTITFFPMIILAWTIERMSILWEEEGAKEVFKQGGGSLMVAILAYLAMSSNIVQHLAFNFLGIHLVILALVLLMGQYTGYKILELKRFKPLVAGDDK